MTCTRLARRFAILCIALLVPFGLPPRAGPQDVDRPADGQVFVPDFWDPAAALDAPKPDELGPIRFVTEDDYPPFGFTLADGTLAGFDVDLAHAICDTLKVACTIQARRYETIVSALRAGTADAAIASMAITGPALAVVDFTAPYYKTPARFVARVGRVSGPVEPETIGTKTIAVLRGTAHEAFLKATFPSAQIRSLGSLAEVRASVMAGSVDLGFGDGIGLAQWLASPQAQGCCSFAGGAFTESRFFGEGAGIAVRKGNAPLRSALDFALARLAAKGAYADLYLKYFPIGLY